MEREILEKNFYVCCLNWNTNKMQLLFIIIIILMIGTIALWSKSKHMSIAENMTENF